MNKKTDLKIIKVKLKKSAYSVYIQEKLIRKVPSYLKELNLGNQGIVVTSFKIYSLYKKLIKTTFLGQDYKIVTVADGEKAKSAKWLFKVIAQIVKADKWNRKVFLVCLGGGTVGDLGGFAASIYKRGVPYVQIPTTLLAQIDASIGGKTAIDLKEAKNILGTFHQPKAVFIDPAFLDTLNLKELKEGLAEAIKYAIIKDKRLFSFLRKHQQEIIALKSPYILRLITTCVKIKAEVVGIDEKEARGIRTILNFGHTFAHALETSLEYRRFSHGEAVSLGMIYAGILSYLLGECSSQELASLWELIQQYSLPTRLPFGCATLYKAMSYDKKFIWGKIRMVLLKKIGKVEVFENIPQKAVKKALSFFCALN